MAEFKLANMVRRQERALRDGRTWNLSPIDLIQAYGLGHRDFRSVKTRSAELELCYETLQDCDFSGADFKGVRLSDSILSDCKFRHADLSESDFCDAVCIGTDFEGARLVDAEFRSANLRDAKLVDCHCGGAGFEGAILTGVNLRHTGGLEYANFRDARDLLVIGPQGSRGDFVYAVRGEKGVNVKAGCFWGDVGEFENRVRATHRLGSEHRLMYTSIATMLKGWIASKDGD